MKGEFSPPLFEEKNPNQISEKETVTQILCVPEAGTNLPVRDLIPNLRAGLNIIQDEVKSSFNLMISWVENQIKPNNVRAQKGNQCDLQGPLIDQLGHPIQVAKGRHHPVSLERRLGLNPTIKELIKERLLKACMFSFSTPILPVKHNGSY